MICSSLNLLFFIVLLLFLSQQNPTFVTSSFSGSGQSRFRNRRQVGSYLGLCPSEHSSGQRHQQGSVTKCGNPRLYWALCEAAWRLLKYQPEYRLCKKWRAQILDPRTLGGRKKQLVVALARGFGVDWWRLCTGQTTPDKLGLVLAD